MEKMLENKGKVTFPPKDGALILVVDDEENMCLALQRILETEGYRVVIAMDGETAVSLIAEIKPDLILLDIMMPGMDGREVSTRAREVSDCAIIYFTARADLTAPENSRELQGEADALLTKPASTKRILAVVDTILSSHPH